MKYLLIAIIFGALAYFVFFSEEPKEHKNINQGKTEEEMLKDEFGIKSTSYQGAIIQTYHKYKNAVQGAKNAVKQMEHK